MTKPKEFVVMGYFFKMDRRMVDASHVLLQHLFETPSKHSEKTQMEQVSKCVIYTWETIYTVYE